MTSGAVTWAPVVPLWSAHGAPACPCLGGARLAGACCLRLRGGPVPSSKIKACPPAVCACNTDYPCFRSIKPRMLMSMWALCVCRHVISSRTCIGSSISALSKVFEQCHGGASCILQQNIQAMAQWLPKHARIDPAPNPCLMEDANTAPRTSPVHPCSLRWCGACALHPSDLQNRQRDACR